MLKKHEVLFQGKYCAFNGPDVTLKLKPDAKPHLAWLYPIPLSQREQFKKELDRQEDISALRLLLPEEVEQTKWAFPMFRTPKKNKLEMRIVGNFRYLNFHYIAYVDFCYVDTLLMRFCIGAQGSHECPHHV